MKVKWLISVVFAFALSLTSASGPAASSATLGMIIDTQDGPLVWHPQTTSGLTGVVAESWVVFARYSDHIEIQFATNSLPENHVFTAHAYVFNHPENCTHPVPAFGVSCSSADITTPGVDGSLIRLVGDVAYGGRLAGSAFIDYNDSGVCFPGQPCHNGIQSASAGLLFCIRDHGPASQDPAVYAEQRSQWNGGCPPNNCHLEQLAPSLAPQL